MQEVTRTYKTYEFSELSEEVQEKVIQDNYDWNVSNSFWYEFAVEDLHTDLRDNYGIEFENVYWDLDRGSFAYLDHPSIVDVDKFLKKAGFDLRTKDAKELQEDACINTRHFGGGTAVNYCNHDDLTECLRERLEEFLSDLRKEYDYQTSREAIVESLEVNEYRFLENGDIFS